MSEFLKYENVFLHYENKLVLRNLSGSLESGKLYVLSGENGAGKTSLLNILSGRISANKGYVGGSKYNRQSIRSLIGVSFLYPHLSVQENLELFCEASVSDLLSAFNIQDYASSLVRDLSQGYIQRVGLITVLRSKAEIVLLDEPSNFLDKNSKELLLVELRRGLDQGKAILLSSHEPEFFSGLDPKFLELRGCQYV